MKPVTTQLELRGEDHFWSLISSVQPGQTFAPADLERQTNGDDRTFRDYIKRLELGGFLTPAGEREPTPPSKNGAKLYLVADYRRSAPRLRPDGTELPERVIDVLWRTIKMVKRFTVGELVDLASSEERPISAATTERYLRHLAQVNVLQERRVKGQPLQYRLINYVGADAPRVLRAHHVYDPNNRCLLGVAQAVEVAA